MDHASLLQALPFPHAPCGNDLSFSAAFDAIQEARRADDPSLAQGEWVTELKEADWPGVIRRCEALLAHDTKDLRVAGWLTEALGRSRGLAGLADGQDILELGCGWGSLTLWMAQRYPRARITAVSNSASQRAWIEARCRERGLHNVRVVTCDVNALELPPAAFDRCVSVEMFEHVRNHEALLGRIAGWLRADGRLFVHIFVHRLAAYVYDDHGEDNWMGRHFFTGGLMPAADTLLHLQRDLVLERRWLVDGTHYQRTAEAWLRNQDRERDALLPILAQAYGGPAQARLWFQRWRMFWMACAELFGYDGGQQWLVSHYLFAPRR